MIVPQVNLWLKQMVYLCQTEVVMLMCESLCVLSCVFSQLPTVFVPSRDLLLLLLYVDMICLQLSSSA